MYIEHLLFLVVSIIVFIWVSRLSYRLSHESMWEFFRDAFWCSPKSDLSGLWGMRQKHWGKKYLKSVWIVLGHLLFPTFHYAKYQKMINKYSRKAIIEKLNYINVYVAIKLSSVIVMTDVVVAIFYRNTDAGINAFNFFRHDQSGAAYYISVFFVVFALIMILFLFSRCLEIFYAFLKDSKEQLSGKKEGSSGLLYYERVELAMRSYAELILNYALIYYFLNYTVLRLSGIHIFDPDKFRGFADALYFSAVTITTIGYGDIVVQNTSGSLWLGALKLLPPFEVINGSILIVVSFTIYASLSISENERRGK